MTEEFKDIVETFNYSLSAEDVAMHDDIHADPLTAPVRVLERVLYFMGMDTRGHIYKTVTQPHRRLNGAQSDGVMFVGRERKDKAWMDSGYATMTGKIESCWDRGLQEELRRMSR